MFIYAMNSEQNLFKQMQILSGWHMGNGRKSKRESAKIETENSSEMNVC